MVLDDMRGAQLARTIEESPDQMIFVNLDGKLVRISAILSVEPMREEQRAEDKKSAMMHHLHVLHTEYDKERLRLASQPPQEKAKRMEVANLVWWAYTRQKSIPSELQGAIEARQLAYFKDNPKNAFANPRCYKDIITQYLLEDERPRVEKNGDIRRIDGLLRQSAMERVESILQADNSAAHNL